MFTVKKMETLFCSFVLLVVFWLLWRGVVWMLRTGGKNNLKFEPLTPADLRVLEEAAARLMEELRATADECVAKIEAACAQASQIKQRFDAAPTAADMQNPNWAGCDISAPELARQVGLTTGEIELMRSLRSFCSGHNKNSTAHKADSESKILTFGSDS